MGKFTSEEKQAVYVALNMAINQYEVDLSNADKHTDENTEAIKEQLKKDIQASKQAREKLFK